MTDVVALPQQVRVDGVDSWASIEVGVHHACALTSDGRAFCWGDNGAGQVGVEVPNEVLAPVQPFPGMRFEALALGFFATCGIDADGRAMCWGDGTPTPTALDPERRYVELAIAREHRCGLTRDGEIFCSGTNGFGELGTGNLQAQPRHTDATPVEGRWASLDLGLSLSCAIDETSRLSCWGLREDLGDTDPTPLPTPVTTAPGWQQVAVAKGLAASTVRDLERPSVLLGQPQRWPLGPRKPASTYSSLLGFASTDGASA